MSDTRVDSRDVRSDHKQAPAPGGGDEAISRRQSHAHSHLFSPLPPASRPLRIGGRVVPAVRDVSVAAQRAHSAIAQHARMHDAVPECLVHHDGGCVARTHGSRGIIHQLLVAWGLGPVLARRTFGFEAIARALTGDVAPSCVVVGLRACGPVALAAHAGAITLARALGGATRATIFRAHEGAPALALCLDHVDVTLCLDHVDLALQLVEMSVEHGPRLLAMLLRPMRDGVAADHYHRGEGRQAKHTRRLRGGGARRRTHAENRGSDDRVEERNVCAQWARGGKAFLGRVVWQGLVRSRGARAVSESQRWDGPDGARRQGPDAHCFSFVARGPAHKPHQIWQTLSLLRVTKGP